MSIAELEDINANFTLYESVKDAVRVSSDDFDSEIYGIIGFAVSDMLTKGVSPTWLGDDVDTMPALAKRAVVVYAKAHFGFDLDTEEAKRFEAAYDSIVCTILNSSHNAVYEQCGMEFAIVQPIDTQTYTGEPIEPPVSVTYLVAGVEIALVEDTDYTVTYSHNVNVGWAIATVTGSFPYVGSVEVPFAIEAA